MSTPTAEILPISVEEEMKRSYLDYAMSVIVSRALPDVRDGLKPVHRRILYAMAEAGYTSDKPFRKSARVVGDVLGKYHPHGQAAIYDSLVRMAQDFSLRLLLVDGHGNFGSMDGDRPAAERYTEVRLKPVSDMCLLEDYDKGTVNFEPNYDGTLEIPTVLPARFPNLLVNGAGGIAVGMATNIPTHNLGEVIDACCALIDQPDLSFEDLLAIVPGPDFPTGGMITSRKGILDAYRTGRGSIPIRGRAHVEEVRKDREAIIITEIPYQVNKSRLVERIAELVNAKELEGISDLRDESDRHGVRVVIELKRDAQADVVLNRLYAMTPLQTSFGVNMLALHGGRPLQMNLHQVLAAFLAFREEVVTRRTRFYLNKARDRAHLVLGLLVAVFHIDAVVALIRASKDAAEARQALMARLWPADDIVPYLSLLQEEASLKEGGYQLSEAQVKAILDLRLHRLTGLERSKLQDEMQGLLEQIKGFLELLASRPKMLELIKTELLEVRGKYADPRRTAIEELSGSQDMEDLIQREDMVVTFSHKGYIKRVALNAYRSQRRGGRGKSAMATREEDVVSQVFVANTHTPLLFFSSGGKAYQLKVYELPLGSPQTRGKPLISILDSLGKDESIATLLPVPENPAEWEHLHVIFVTSAGHVRRNALSDFQNIRANGKMAMKLEEAGERLIAVQTCRPDQDVLLTTRQGRAIRFEVEDVRQFTGRTSTGVRGVRLQKGDAVVAMTILEGTAFGPEERELYLRQATKLRRSEGEGEDEADLDDPSLLGIGKTLAPEVFQAMQEGEQFILTVSERGFGKRTSAYAYRKTGRGGQGVATLDVNQRTGDVIDAFPVAESDHVMLLTNLGQLTRFPVAQVRIAGRKTQGVTLFRLDKDERVTSVVRVEEDEDGEDSPALAPLPAPLAAPAPESAG